MKLLCYVGIHDKRMRMIPGRHLGMLSSLPRLNSYHITCRRCHKHIHDGNDPAYQMLSAPPRPERPLGEGGTDGQVLWTDGKWRDPIPDEELFEDRNNRKALEKVAEKSWD